MTKVGLVQRGALYKDDAQDVTPLTIGNLSSHPVPTELLEEDILRRVDVQVAIGPSPYSHALPTIHLHLVERGAANDEEIDLRRGC